MQLFKATPQMEMEADFFAAYMMKCLQEKRRTTMQQPSEAEIREAIETFKNKKMETEYDRQRAVPKELMHKQKSVSGGEYWGWCPSCHMLCVECLKDRYCPCGQALKGATNGNE